MRAVLRTGKHRIARAKIAIGAAKAFCEGSSTMQALRILEFISLADAPAMELLYQRHSGLENQAYTRQIEEVFHAGIGGECGYAPYLGGFGHLPLLVFANCPHTQIQWLAENRVALNPAVGDFPTQILLKQVESFQPDIIVVELGLGLGRKELEPLLDGNALVVGRIGNTPLNFEPQVGTRYDLLILDRGVHPEDFAHLAPQLHSCVHASRLREHEVTDIHEVVVGHWARIPEHRGMGRSYQQKVMACLQAIKTGQDCAQELQQLAECGENAYVLLGQAICRQRAGDMVNASSLLERALSVDPHCADIVLYSAQFAAGAGRFSQAAEIVEEYLTEFPFDNNVQQLYLAIVREWERHSA